MENYKINVEYDEKRECYTATIEDNDLFCGQGPTPEVATNKLFMAISMNEEEKIRSKLIEAVENIVISVKFDKITRLYCAWTHLPRRDLFIHAETPEEAFENCLEKAVSVEKMRLLEQNKKGGE